MSKLKDDFDPTFYLFSLPSNGSDKMSNIASQFYHETNIDSIKQVDCRVCSKITPVIIATAGSKVGIEWNILERTGQCISQ
jgi:hypothetical protein